MFIHVAIYLSADQKPIHENEAESSGRGTLCWKGMPAVPVKSNVAASRSRSSILNSGSDDAAFEPFVELLFKLRTNRTIKLLAIPDGVKMSLSQSDSGSYNEEAFLDYLRRWLPEWTEERAKQFDYRIFLLDDFRVHNMESVKQLLWSRGFFRVRIRPCPCSSRSIELVDFYPSAFGYV